MDGRRCIATATYTPAGYPGLKSGWLLKAYGVCWTDERARGPNRMTGKAHAELRLVRRKRDARRTLDGLARFREPGGGQR